MTLQLKPGTSWWETYARCVQVAPEAFDSDRLRNLIRGEWRRVGMPGDHVTPVDGTPIPGPPRVDYDEAVAAVATACDEHAAVGQGRPRRAPGAGDRRRSTRMTEHRDLLALLLVWEIGKPWRLACADVDRCLDGVRWYVGEIERQLRDRRPAERTPLPGPGVQHRQLELPDERAGARRARPAAGRQRGGREDPEPGRLPLPHAGPRADAAGRAAGHAALGYGRAAGRGADPQRGHRRAGLRRRPRQRPPGRGLPGRHRPAAHARAGGPQRLGHLGLQPVATCWPSTCARASSTPSSAAPPTPATSSSAGCSRPSWRRTCRS